MKKKLIIGIISGVCGIAIIIGAVFGIMAIANAPASGTAEERLSAADSLADEGKLTKAENTYESIIEENGAEKEASLGLADVYMKQGKYDEAAKAVKEAIKSNPEDIALYDNLMQVYRDGADTKGAFEYIETIDDKELRRKYIDAAYDRTNENNLVVGNTMGNLSSGGVMAFKDDAIFYCDIAKGNKLFKIEGGKTTQLSDGNISSLNIVGDYIYFVDKARDYSIFKMKTDGSDYVCVKEIMATNLTIIGDKMYFINWNEDCCVYSIDMNGKNLTQITTKPTEHLYAYGQYLFVSDRDSMTGFYRLELDGTNETFLSEDNVYFVSGYDNNIYFRSGNDSLNIYRMTTDGTVYEPLNASRSGYINVSDGGEVFFIDFANNGSIVRMNEDGSGQTILCSDGAENLSIDGDWVYYFSDYHDKKLFRIKKDGSAKECLN